METVKPNIVSVTALNTYIKGLVDGDYKLKNIFLCGEISNFTNHVRTGHFYLTLKDESSAIKAVMFSYNASRLKFMPENGMKVLVFGSVSVFPRDGQYQFYIENMQPDGLGSLNLAFEQLKERLSKEGIFAVEHKKPLPAYPRVIGVVTSPTGAAFQDIKNVLRRRWPVAKILLCESQVQGESAPRQIAEGIRRLSADGRSDVIIVARGGGSIEDLWAFNDETVAYAIYDSNIPVVSGVGHETDFTIADFAADLRAPTPSAAAELSTPDITTELQQIMALKLAAQRSMLRRVETGREQINRLLDRNVMKSPLGVLNERKLILDSQIEKMNHYIITQAASRRAELSLNAGKLDSISPLKVLSRGYGIPMTTDGRIISSIKAVSKGDKLNLTLADGNIDCTVNSVNTEEVK